MSLAIKKPVTLNLFQGLNFPAALESKMLKQVQHDEKCVAYLRRVVGALGETILMSPNAPTDQRRMEGELS